MTTKYERRTADQRVAELEAKIKGIREREQRRAARKNPVAVQMKIAERAVNKALEATDDERLQAALNETYKHVGACAKIAVDLANETPAEPQPQQPRQRRTRRTEVAS